ncbi:MAG: sulfatase activating formylglycine-generating enzyme [Crocinitomicaceae bacterium]|jgi:formylglycine-generating enzyme required for sulfatase activity
MFKLSSTSKRFLVIGAAPVLAISALALFNANAGPAAVAPTKKEAISDVKPALANDDLDEEQLRLATVIHKRITDYQEIKNKTHDNQPQPFTSYEEKLNSGVKFEMLPVKAGSFTWKGEKEGDSLEVTLSPFWMGKKEVTWDEYDPFVSASGIPRQKDGTVLDFARGAITNDIDFIARPTPPYHPMTWGMERDGYPAISMTQHAANKYCQWISYQTGHFYRLPTEAEWEYASRAGSITKYPWGENAKDADQYAYFGGDAASQYQKPGTKKPNAWGFEDMIGNVVEWTLDQHVEDRRAYFDKDKVHNPWIKATNPYPHVVRGGHWKQKLEEISKLARVATDPKWKAIDPQEPKSLWYFTNVQNIGFRIVRPEKIPTPEEMYHYWNSGVEEDGEFAFYGSEYRADSKIHKVEPKK